MVTPSPTFSPTGALRGVTMVATFLECTFRQNSAASGGGAVRTSNVDVALQQSSFEGNSAGILGAETGGGALYVTGRTGVVSSEGCRLTGNTATSRGGAMMLVDFVQALVLRATAFVGNVAAGSSTSDPYGGQGGALYVRSVGSRLIDRCSFVNNSAVGGAGHGGAAYILGTTAVTNSAFTANRVVSSLTGASGGAIFWSNLTAGVDGQLTVDGTTFVNNSVTPYGATAEGTNGGGALAMVGWYASLTVVSSAFEGNAGWTRSGGALLLYPAAGTTPTVSVSKNNFTANVAGN